MRRRVIAATGKMYKTLAETRAFFSSFLHSLPAQHCDIVVARRSPLYALRSRPRKAPASPSLVKSLLEQGRRLHGEVSAPCCRSRLRYIIGHSGAAAFRETDEQCRQETDVDASASRRCLPGETQEDRDDWLTNRCSAPIQRRPAR